MRAVVKGGVQSTVNGETSFFEIFLFVIFIVVVGFIVYKQVKPPKVDIVLPIAERGESSETKEGSKEKNGFQKKQKCIEKDEIEIAKEIVDKNIEHIGKGKKYSVSKFITSLKCIPKTSRKKIIQICKKSWFTKGLCVSVSYDIIKNSSNIAKNSVRYVISLVENSPSISMDKPEIPKINSGNNDLKETSKKAKPEIKKEIPTELLKPTDEDIQKKAKNTCIANGKNRTELRDIAIDSLVLTSKFDEEISYEWRIKKGEKTICTYYVKTSGTVIF